MQGGWNKDARCRVAGAKTQGGWNKDVGWLEKRYGVARTRTNTQGGWNNGKDAGWLEQRCGVVGAKMQGG